MSSTTIISSSLLDTNGMAYQNMFSPQDVHDNPFFDEGPKIRPVIRTSTSGAMDTIAIDAYTQGIEITRMRQYDAGIAKIWTGDPGHQLKNNRYGMDNDFSPGRKFADADLFNPVRYLEIQDAASPLWDNIMTFPVTIGDNTQLENFNFNGVIEPLTIRSIASFFSTEMPGPAHTVKGALMAGNLDHFDGTDRILNVDFCDIDAISAFADSPYFNRAPSAPLFPFPDVRLCRNEFAPASEPSDMIAALSLMTGSTDNYVKYSDKAGTAGWTFDSVTNAGTDSLAFGGTGHSNSLREPSPVFDVGQSFRFSAYWRADYAQNVRVFPDNDLTIFWYGWPQTATRGISMATGPMIWDQAPPTVGALQNGRAPASFNGIDFSDFSCNSDLVDVEVWKLTEGSIIAVIKDVGSPAPTGNTNDDPLVLGNDTNEVGLTLTSSGINAYIVDSGGLQTTGPQALSAGYHLVMMRWDGANLGITVDSAAEVTVPALDVLTISSSFLFCGYNPLGNSFMIAELLELAATNYYFTDDEYAAYKAYVNTTYDLAL